MSYENLQCVYEYVCKRYESVLKELKYFRKSEDATLKDNKLNLTDIATRELWYLRGQADVLQSIIKQINELRRAQRNRKEFVGKPNKKKPY